MFKAYNGLRRPLANTKRFIIDTWSNSSCQVAAFLKTHGWHTFFLHRNWFTDWRLLAPKNSDHLISFDHFGMKSKLLLCVCLGASSCNLASYAGALTSTTNQTPSNTWSTCTGASCWVSNYTSEHRQSQLHTPTAFIEIFFKGPRVSQFQVTVGSYPTLCCPKLSTLKKTPTITKNVCTNMHRLNLATSTIVHLLRKLPPSVPQLQRAHLLWFRPAFSIVAICFDSKSD